MEHVGRQIAAVGILITLIGALLWVGGRLSWLRLGKLPGDIVIQRPSYTISVPLATCLVLSMAMTLGLMVVRMIRH